MNQSLYEIPSCRCKEEFSITKKRKAKKRKRRDEKLFLDLDLEISRSKTFQIKYEKNLSSIAKLLLNSFQNKYFYYAIDDILYLLNSNPIERDNLLAILYSPVLSLQNTLSTNFLDILISKIYISEVVKANKFLTNNYQNFEPFSYITIELLYKTTKSIKKEESLW
uniref:hypothetical protein n=1 Tax=Nitzschia dubiiformis TaxID=515482 RepID=UPI00211582BF|nr:hypothetical protein NRL27_pgp088 [Nitzschia dubiiformis]UTQ75592.1 hypothetical protein [Nitzschia dubiiformis]